MLEKTTNLKKIDMHIHANNTPPQPKKLLTDMRKAGIYGGCIFSNQPKRMNKKQGTDFEERTKEVLAWTKDYEDRLFPVVWIHPYEDGIMEHIHAAVEQGVLGFKIICTDFYVYEDQCMKVLEEIAALNKPVFFHSGILWGGGASKYNRPLHWEALAEIENLRFSMGHCSWPWHDECIAVYGAFLDAVASKANAPEMFFDLTPGTPLIYREDLLRKLFTVGYDVPDNIMFGSDTGAGEYSSDWVAQWLKVDGQIMDDLGVTEEIQNKIYYDNVLRFLGRKEKDFTHIRPSGDSFQSWNPGVVREKI